MTQMLHRVTNPAWRAINEGRLGSINESSAEQGDNFWLCLQRCGLTGLHTWHETSEPSPNFADERTNLLIGNVDHMRSLLANYGFPPGDRLLQLTAQILQGIESKNITAFRSSGDEFAVWTRSQSPEEAGQLAETINAQVRALQIPLQYDSSPLSNCSLTWGVVSAPPHWVKIEAMFSKARELVSEAKSRQRGTVNAAPL